MSNTIDLNYLNLFHPLRVILLRAGFYYTVTRSLRHAIPPHPLPPPHLSLGRVRPSSGVLANVL